MKKMKLPKMDKSTQYKAGCNHANLTKNDKKRKKSTILAKTLTKSND
jgi:hypothetical protein